MSLDIVVVDLTTNDMSLDIVVVVDLTTNDMSLDIVVVVDLTTNDMSLDIVVVVDLTTFLSIYLLGNLCVSKTVSGITLSQGKEIHPNL